MKRRHNCCRQQGTITRIYVGSYTVGNWYRVTLDNNMIDKTYDVYIDGVLTTSDIPMNPLDTPTTLSLIAHNVTTSMAYFDNVGLYTVLPDFEAIDDIAPALTAGSVSRISDAEATITFTSDEAGKYYYEVTESGAGAPVIDTSTPGTVCDTNEQTISLNSLAAGAKDIYIVVKDANDNVSDELLMEIPAYIPPVPPTASSVVITGTPSVGEMITGGYTYNLQRKRRRELDVSMAAGIRHTVFLGHPYRSIPPITPASSETRQTVLPTQRGLR